VGFYATWPFFGCLAVLLALARLPLFTAADTPPSPRPDRVATLDGLRGFLALAVFFHHAAIYHRFLRDGAWVLPPSRFYALLGPVGVSVFFMITGYLFWSQMIGSLGRPAWLRLYVGRAFRIGPLYLVAVASMLAFVLAGTGARLNVSPSQLAGEIGCWLALGFVVGPDVNGYPATSSVLAGVTWTLGYEWIFYLSLPVAALAARGRRAHLPFALAGLAGSLAWTWRFSQPSAFASDPFCVAMLRHLPAARAGAGARAPAAARGEPCLSRPALGLGAGLRGAPGCSGHRHPHFGRAARHRARQARRRRAWRGAGAGRARCRGAAPGLKRRIGNAWRCRAQRAEALSVIGSTWQERRGGCHGGARDRFLGTRARWTGVSFRR
jgi:hypothetical protein